ncbi:MAG: SpoIIE family protein phosphatase [Marinoscillum sp.]
MSSVSLLGHFETNQDEVFFEVNNSTRSNGAALNQIRSKIFEEDIESLTIEYDDNTFTHFLKTDNGKISFIEGKREEILLLQNKLKNGLEGELLLDNEPLEEPTADHEKTTPHPNLNEGKSDHARIHSSFLQNISSFKSAYTNAEIYFQPFEEPGGDFYWTKDYQYRNLVVVGDCTGHGMQGAMIGMSVMTLLKQFFRLPPTNLKEALYEFHHQMHELLEEEHESFDVELGFILMDKRKNKLDFVGSGIDLLIKSKNALKKCRTRKRNLIQDKLEEFTFQVESGDQLFAYTDGIIDQFDKDNHKKFKSSGITSLVEVLPATNTMDAFSEAFNQFRESNGQLDDQTMIVLTV